VILPGATAEASPPAQPPSPREAETAVREDQTVRQILQELRNQRRVTDDFSYKKVIAIVLQMIVIVLLGAALLMGMESQESFLRFVAVALLAQLAVIAALLFSR
jgi:hypothetical protein